MEELSDWMWTAIGTAVPLLIVAVLALALLKILGGNERYKSEGWGHLKTVLLVVVVGVAITLFFPGVREKLGKVMDDPCQWIGLQCRR